MKRNRAEPLSAIEMGALIGGLLGPGPYDERTLALEKRLATWEAEQERLKDPCGALCKTLAKAVPGVDFDDTSRPGDSMFRVRMSARRDGRKEPDPTPPVPVFCQGVQYGEQLVSFRWVPPQWFADTCEISQRMLVEEGEEPFVPELTRWATRLLEKLK